MGMRSCAFDASFALDSYFCLGFLPGAMPVLEIKKTGLQYSKTQDGA